MSKVINQACERNKAAILNVLQAQLIGDETILEIGSGTGQHAVYFGTHLPKTTWLTSDLAVNHNVINSWITATKISNVHSPLTLDVDNSTWPVIDCTGAFTANTLHILTWKQVVKLFHHIEKQLKSGMCFYIYGPFNYDGEYTSPGNQAFDQQLKAENPNHGLRDLNEIKALAQQTGFEFIENIHMPANNMILVLKRRQMYEETYQPAT